MGCYILKRQTKVYIVSIAIALAVGILSSLFTGGGNDLFDSIVKPPLTPPSIVFPIVWTVLFTLMGISSAMVYLKAPKDSSLKIYAANLVVNFIWSLIFFNLRAFLFAFFWLLLLLALIIAMTYGFGRVSKTAAYLQIPYIAWVTFAGYLTLAIYFLN